MHLIARNRRPLAALVAAGMAAGLLTAAVAAPGDPAGTISSVAGTNVGSAQYGFSGDGGPAVEAQIHHPRAIAFDKDGNTFFADTLNQRIRRIDTAGVITTVAGNGTEGYSGDSGPALEAALNQPHGVAVDKDGILYIADSANHRIRKVTADGQISTYAGDGTPGALGDGGPAAAAQVKDPKTITMDPSGAVLYIADTGNNRIRKIDLGTGTISTVAGVTRAGFLGDGGQAAQAQLNSPRGVGVASDGVVFIADSDNHRIRKVGTDGVISTVVGNGTAGFAGDGGPATEAQLNDPRAVAVDGAGNLYIGEELGQRIRKVDTAGTISTLAGNGTPGFAGDGGPASAAQVDHLRAVTLDAKGNLWVADTFNNRVRVISGVADVVPTPGSTTTTAPGTTPTTAPGATPTTAPTGGSQAPGRSGYWALGQDGKIYPFGDAQHLGDPSAAIGANKAVAIVPTPTHNGYWVLDASGTIHTFGDALPFGSPGPGDLRNSEKVRSLTPTPSGKGYWLFTNRGKALNYGDAKHFGDMSKVDLNGPVLGSVATPTGLGYFMVASDGGVFTFGDAKFHGSTGDVKLNKPVEGLVPTLDNQGYWLVASDGGIFSFGAAPFRGSLGAVRLNKPVVGMVRFGDGYLMVAADGGVFNFSDLPFSGSLGDNPPEKPVVAVATLDIR